MITDIQMVRIIDLIEAGTIPGTAKLYGYHGQHRFEAAIEKDGTIVCGERIYSSPSVAAGQAITERSGRRSPKRNYWSINGWLFWMVSAPNGEAKTLADLRREFFEAQSSATAGN